MWCSYHLVIDLLCESARRRVNIVPCHGMVISTVSQPVVASSFQNLDEPWAAGYHQAPGRCQFCLLLLLLLLLSLFLFLAAARLLPVPLARQPPSSGLHL